MILKEMKGILLCPSISFDSLDVKVLIQYALFPQFLPTDLQDLLGLRHHIHGANVSNAHFGPT